MFPVSKGRKAEEEKNPTSRFPFEREKSDRGSRGPERESESGRRKGKEGLWS